MQKKILQEVEGTELAPLAQCTYMGSCVGAIRQILHDRAEEAYKGELKEMQRVVRKNWCNIFRYRDTRILTRRQRLGILYAMLPLPLCRHLAWLVRRDYED